MFAKPSARAVGSSASPIDPRCLRTPPGLIGVGIMSTVGNGLGASQDCLNYIARFNAAAQSRRDEAIDAIAPRTTGKIAFGANPNDSTVTLNGTAVTFAASPSAGRCKSAARLPRRCKILLRRWKFSRMRISC